MSENSEKKAVLEGLKSVDILLAFSEMVESSGEWYGRVGNLKKTQPEVARALIHLIQTPATEEWAKNLFESITEELDAKQVGLFVKAFRKLGRPPGIEKIAEIPADDLIAVQKQAKKFAKSLRKIFKEEK